MNEKQRRKNKVGKIKWEKRRVEYIGNGRKTAKALEPEEDIEFGKWKSL